MSDEQLDTIMLSIFAEFTETGYKRMTGFLKAEGLFFNKAEYMKPWEESIQMEHHHEPWEYSV